MHNSLILGRFFDFLREMDLLTPYMETLVKSTGFSPRFLETFFFACEPSGWISGAFVWETQTSINWCSVNSLWLVRLNVLKNNKSSK